MNNPAPLEFFDAFEKQIALSEKFVCTRDKDFLLLSIKKPRVKLTDPDVALVITIRLSTINHFSEVEPSIFSVSVNNFFNGTQLSDEDIRSAWGNHIFSDNIFHEFLLWKLSIVKLLSSALIDMTKDFQSRYGGQVFTQCMIENQPLPSIEHSSCKIRRFSESQLNSMVEKAAQHLDFANLNKNRVIH